MAPKRRKKKCPERIFRIPGFKGNSLLDWHRPSSHTLTSSFTGFTSHHRRNLFELLDYASKQRDYATTAAVCAILLRLQTLRWQDMLDPDSAPERCMLSKPQDLYDDLGIVLPHVVEVIKMRGMPFDEVDSALRGILGVEPSSEGKQMWVLELAMTLLHQGDLAAAYDMLSSRQFRFIGPKVDALLDPATAFTRAAMMALIRHHQWLEEYDKVRDEYYREDMGLAPGTAAAGTAGQGPAQAAASNHDDGANGTQYQHRAGPSSQAQTQALGGSASQHELFASSQAYAGAGYVSGSGSGSAGAAGGHGSGGGGGGGGVSSEGGSSMMMMLSHDPRVWARAQSVRRLRDLYRDAEKHCRDALASSARGSSLISFLLVHMHAVAGRLKAAADAAVAAAEAAPHDADAAGLAAIMLQLAGAIKADDMLVQQERAGLHVETVVGGGGGGGSGGGGEGDGVSSAGALHRAMRYQLAQLQADGSCGAALAGLAASADHCNSCLLALVHGCLLTLDVCGDPGAPVPHEADAWQLAADGLAAIATAAAIEISDDAQHKSSSRSAARARHVAATTSAPAARRAALTGVLRFKTLKWKGGVGRPGGSRYNVAARLALIRAQRLKRGLAGVSAAHPLAATAALEQQQRRAHGHGHGHGHGHMHVYGEALERDALAVWRELLPLLHDRAGWWPALHFHTPPTRLEDLVRGAALHAAQLLQGQHELEGPASAAEHDNRGRGGAGGGGTYMSLYDDDDEDDDDDDYHRIHYGDTQRPRHATAGGASRGGRHDAGSGVVDHLAASLVRTAMQPGACAVLGQRLGQRRQQQQPVGLGDADADADADANAMDVDQDVEDGAAAASGAGAGAGSDTTGQAVMAALRLHVLQQISYHAEVAAYVCGPYNPYTRFTLEALDQLLPKVKPKVLCSNELAKARAEAERRLARMRSGALVDAAGGGGGGGSGNEGLGDGGGGAARGNVLYDGGGGGGGGDDGCAAGPREAADSDRVVWEAARCAERVRCAAENSLALIKHFHRAAVEDGQRQLALRAQRAQVQ